MNRAIRRQYLQVELKFQDLISSGIRGIDAKKLRDLLMGITSEGEKEDNMLFEHHFIAFKESHQNKGTLSIYENTLKRMRDFDPFLSERTFDDINKKWLTDFDRFLSLTSKSANARAIHFQNIRSVFNDAIDDEIIQVYPFRKFKIKYEETRRRSLTVEQLLEIMNLPCQGFQL